MPCHALQLVTYRTPTTWASRPNYTGQANRLPASLLSSLLFGQEMCTRAGEAACMRCICTYCACDSSPRGIYMNPACSVLSPPRRSPDSTIDLALCMPLPFQTHTGRSSGPGLLTDFFHVLKWPGHGVEHLPRAKHKTHWRCAINRRPMAEMTRGVRRMRRFPRFRSRCRNYP